jgi:hypothetical protein
LIGAVVAIGAAVRFYNLGGRSLWLDEVISSQATRINSFAELIAWVKADVDQVPAFSTITWLLRGLGDGEVALRLPSAIAGTLTIVAVYLLAKQIYGFNTALVAALLMALLPFAVWYSQEARAYALLMLVTTLQMLFAYRVKRDGRLVDWSGLTIFSILNLYTHYMALAVTGAAYAYLGLCFLMDAFGRRLSVRQVFRAIGSSALIVLAFVPWLKALVTFLRSPDHGFARFGADAVTVTQVRTLLDGLGFSGLLLAFLVVGLVAVTLRVARSCDGGGLLLAWMALPMLALAVKMRGGVLYLNPRYLIFLVPAMVITSAIGVTDLARLLAVAARRIKPVRARNWAAAVAVVITALLLVQTIPALASSLERPKDDYRGMAGYVARASPPGSTVLALGQYAGFVVIGLGHYFAQTHSAVVVTNGAWLDDHVASRLTTGRGTVWGAIFEPSSAESATASEQARAVNRSFTHLLLVRPDPGLTPEDQARQLLSWDSSFVPRLRSSLDVIDMGSGGARVGANLLSAATHWTVSRTISDGNGGFQLQPSGAEATVRATLDQLTPGQRYLISFRYRNSGLRGSQTVMIVASDAAGKQLDVFPSRFGYACPTTNSWMEGFFGVTIPDGGQGMTVWLRANGSGEADFEGIQIRKVA